MTPDVRLLRGIAAHGLMGAVIGTLFMGILLLTDMFGLRAMIASAELPLTTLIIFGVVLVTHFAFGAGITGFLFMIADGAPDNNDRAS